MIILDTEKQDTQIVERIEKVRVWVKGEVRLGDFDGPNGGGTLEDAQDGPKKKYTNHNFELEKKVRICKKCGKEGHRADSKEFHPAE